VAIERLRARLAEHEARVAEIRAELAAPVEVDVDVVVRDARSTTSRRSRPIRRSWRRSWRIWRPRRRSMPAGRGTKSLIWQGRPRWLRGLDTGLIGHGALRRRGHHPVAGVASPARHKPGQMLRRKENPRPSLSGRSKRQRDLAASCDCRPAASAIASAISRPGPTAAPRKRRPQPRAAGVCASDADPRLPTTFQHRYDVPRVRILLSAHYGLNAGPRARAPRTGSGPGRPRG
jgi:hypothetical protein